MLSLIMHMHVAINCTYFHPTYAKLKTVGNEDFIMCNDLALKHRATSVSITMVTAFYAAMFSTYKLTFYLCIYSAHNTFN